MTAKRFMYELHRACFRDNGRIIDTHEVVQILNEQHETIQRLKQNIDELLSINVEEELLKENEQLKEQVGELKKENGKLHKQNSDLRKRIRMLVKE